MKRMVGCLVVLALVAPVSAQLARVSGRTLFQLPEAWQNWRYSAPIEAAPASAGRLIGVVVSSAVSTRARRDWIDLRAIDSRGSEVPFVLHARLGGTTFNRRLVPLLEPSAVAGKYQQVVADAGDGRVVHNSIKLHLETTQNLLGWVEIAVSGDLKDWRVVRDRAPIYVLRIEGRGENTDVSYPDSASRYVRIRILDGSGTYTLQSAELGRETSTVAERVPSGVELAASTNQTGSSVWTSNDDASGLPISGVAFETTQPSFVRAASVESSDDGERWALAGSGDILRAKDAAGERAWLTVSFSEFHARHWRVTVNNRNDAPVADLRPVLLTTPRRVVLKQDSGESYRLLYGNPRGQAPRYDLAQLTDVKALDAAEPARLGSEEENPAWIDPSPWTERYEAVLWAALGLAVVMLAIVAVRTLRSSPVS